eukprot:1733821-Alexandrium_andersonii.AAC.1
MVPNDFLQQFGNNYRRGPVVPGYMGIFTAWNELGCLQIVATYAPGEPAQRTSIWQALADSRIILPELDSLCIMS